MRRTPILLAAGLVSLLAAGCSLPSREQWAQINQHGLLPILIDGRETVVASNSAGKPSEQHAIRVQAVTTPQIVKIPTASPVPGRSGYAYSPYTTPQRAVDIRGFQAGEEVRCPFTGRAFLVPGAPVPATTAVAVHRPQPRVTQVVSSDPTVPTIDESLTRLEPADAPPPATTESVPSLPPPAPASPPPTTAAAPEKSRPQIPYGTRVAGRPGFVYSPFAGKTQLVDVANTAPGVVVKCPYTNKLFRVPEVSGEEVKPVETAPAADTANSAAPPAPAETPAASPEPASAPQPAPDSSLSSPPLKQP